MSQEGRKSGTAGGGSESEKPIGSDALVSVGASSALCRARTKAADGGAGGTGYHPVRRATPLRKYHLIEF